MIFHFPLVLLVLLKATEISTDKDYLLFFLQDILKLSSRHSRIYEGLQHWDPNLTLKVLELQVVPDLQPFV